MLYSPPKKRKAKKFTIGANISSNNAVICSAIFAPFLKSFECELFDNNNDETNKNILNINSFNLLKIIV